MSFHRGIWGLGFGIWDFRADVSAVARRAKAERGMSLVEATVILMVLATLTAVIAPAAGTYLQDARNVKAAEDVEAIGSAIDRLLSDTGLLCLAMASSSCAKSSGRVELLVSGTAVGANEPTVSAAALGSITTDTASATTLNWAGGTSEVGDSFRDLMDDQFVTNAAGYTAVVFTKGGGPRVGLGWRGSYLNGPIGMDPWGRMYQASTVFLSIASDAVDGTGAGALRGGWTNNVVVLSAGTNGNVETPFGGVGTTSVGDDVTYVFQGSTR